MRVLVARIMHHHIAPHLEDAWYRFGRFRAARGHGGAERRKHGHLIGVAIPAAEEATVFELLRLAPELDDARDLDDFVCTADRIFEWTFLWGRFGWKFQADASMRTAEIGGRSRQAQDDNQS